MEVNSKNFIIVSSVYFAAGVSLIGSLNSIALYLVIPFAFIFCFFLTNTLKYNIWLRILVVLYVWIVFSSLGAVYTDSANRELRQILGTFLLSYILSSLCKKQSNIPWVYGVYLVLYLGAWKYASENILSVMSDNDRLNDAKLNANTLAYYTFYVTYALYILGEIVNSWKKNLFRILFIGTIILSFYVAILTASRQVLIIQIPLIICLLFVRYIKKSYSSLLIVFSIFLVSIFCYNFIGEKIYEGSLLKQRNEVKIEDDERVILLKEAVDVGLEHPLWGVGPGNFRHYSSLHNFSHCTYTELLANTGILGSGIFIFLLFLFLKTQWDRYKRTRDKQFLIFLLFGIFFVIDNIFYVFYADMWLFAYFILVASHSDCYYKNIKKERGYIRKI